MNNLNLFNYYQNTNPKHENNLTRAFLICLENIPSLQHDFFDLISKEYEEPIFDTDLPLDSIIESVYTQISNKNKNINHESMQNRKLVSILISDERLNTDFEIANSNREAIYDGIVLCKPGLLFIIENKPNVFNVWENQLSPNIKDEHNIKIVKKPCSVSWAEIIVILNRLLKSDFLTSLEDRLISDFISFIDEYRPELNPYVCFETCRGNKELINKRCKQIMSEIVINGNRRTPEYHKGWGNYISSGKTTVTRIKVDFEERNGSKYIALTMITGDTQISSKDTYRLIDENRFADLMEETSIVIKSNFHYQFMSSNLIHFEGNANIVEYISFWKRNLGYINQIRRFGSNNRKSFDDFNAILIENGIIGTNEIEEFNHQIAAKKYSKLDVCAGIIIVRYWSLDEAIVLDNEDKMVEVVTEAIERIFNVFSQSIF